MFWSGQSTVILSSYVTTFLLLQYATFLVLWLTVVLVSHLHVFVFYVVAGFGDGLLRITA